MRPATKSDFKTKATFERRRMKRGTVAAPALIIIITAAMTCPMPQVVARVSASGTANKYLKPAPGERVSARITRKTPQVSFTDGRDVLVEYSGAEECREALMNNRAVPLSLATADFDEDGLSDLISGYGGPQGGIVVIHRGNADSIYSNSPAAEQRRAEGVFTDAPFISPALVYAIPHPADFLGAGDFDADGHCDVVAAGHGGRALQLLPGTGLGGFDPPIEIALPGEMTSMLAGDINRADGLADVAVAVTDEEGSKLLVYEGPDGAFRDKPDVIRVPAEITSLAVGQFDDAPPVDLAASAANQLLILYGRDRKLSGGGNVDKRVSKAALGKRSFPFALRSVAAGDFTGDAATDIALLGDDGAVHLLSDEKAKGRKVKANRKIGEWKNETLTGGDWSRADRSTPARAYGLPSGEIVLADPANHSLHILSTRPEASTERATSDHRVAAVMSVEGAPAAILPMRLNEDALSDLVILKSGSATLSVALTRPQATFAVTNTSDAGQGSLRQAIIDANQSPGADLITFGIPGGGVPAISPASLLPEISDAVTIDGTTQAGGRVELNGSNVFDGPYGLRVRSGNSVIRGLVINRFTRMVNGIRTGGAGIELLTAGGNIVENNFIGTNASGTAVVNFNSISLSEGVLVNNSARNTIGGTTSAGRNILSGNADGVFLSGAGATDNLVAGNFIGTDISGSANLGNGLDGVYIERGSRNIIGGTTAGARNLISGNLNGVHLAEASANIVQGNFIGTNVSGTADLGNSFSGVFIDSSSDNTVGGSTVAARNLISGNDTAGVAIEGLPAPTRNLVQGNFIGTNATGTGNLGNSRSGVFMSNAVGNMIGGQAGAGNTIAFNGGNGVAMSSASSRGNAVLTNSIFSNASSGIRLQQGANNNRRFPVLMSVSGGEVRGTLSGPANTTLTVQFFSNNSCENLGFGEGERFIGAIAATTGANGTGTFRFSLQNTQAQSITATATDPGGNTSEFSNCIGAGSRGADLSITNITSASAIAGAQLTYTLRVMNAGPEAATGVTVTDTIPAGARLVFVETSQGTSRLPAFGSSGNVVSSLGTINAGDSATITVVVVVNAAGGTTLTNTARVSSASNDPNQANNLAVARTSIGSGEPGRSANLSVTSEASSQSAASGERISYRVTVTNSGPSNTFALINDVMPVGTTFNSVEGEGFTFFSKPEAGRYGLIEGSFQLNSGQSKSFTLTVNVISASGSLLVNEALTFPAAFGSGAENNLSAEGGRRVTTIPLTQGPADDPDPTDNSRAEMKPVRGGGIVELVWEQLPATDADQTPPPRIVQLRPGTALQSSAVSPEISISVTRPISPRADCPLPRRIVEYKMYISNQCPVQVTPGNLWRVVQASPTQANAPAPPSGAFYIITTVWDCNGARLESVGSNCANVPAGGPTVAGESVQVSSKSISVTGSGFSSGVRVFVDGVGFIEAPRVTNGTLVVQGGKLANGKKIKKIIKSGSPVVLSFRNPNGGISSVLYTKP